MMRKKVIIMIIVSALLSATYIFAIDHYDTMPKQLAFLKDKISIEDVHYTEVGVELSGIIYDEGLEFMDLQNKQYEMAEQLAHTNECSKLCQVTHSDLSKQTIDVASQVKKAEVENSGEGWQYIFTLKNQKDIHENSYYYLKITGAEDIQHMDILRNRGYDQFKAWHVKSKESIYFKGFMVGSLSEEERTQLKDQLLQNLNAKETNSYQDDLNETTCAYYGYTPYIKEHVVEVDGQKTNLQISFKYDETRNETDIIIAFPFYNDPF